MSNQSEPHTLTRAKTGELLVAETSGHTAPWGMIAKTNRRLFNECLRHAKTCGQAENYEEVLQWCSVAAWAAWGKSWFGELSSQELELELLRAARQLPLPTRTAVRRDKPRWLHVLTEAYETFGHTNFCRRWIQNDKDVTHDVMLVNQHNEIPDNLAATVKNAHGELIVLDPLSPLMQRANELRKYAWQNADVVVVHTHPDEILATVAFGVEGGPPVLLVNHSDHVFWTGGSVADRVIEIRQSGQAWTRELRGVTGRSIILPIPLLEDAPGNSVANRMRQRQLVRKNLGIPEDAILLLTVGALAKYSPMPELDFVAVALEIVLACPNAYLVAVGPRENEAWKKANQLTSGRMLAIGRAPDSRVYCRAADVYLEGFPVGSLTALLEAGQAGLPCVRGPGESVPPFSSDSESLEGVPQPENVKAYIQIAISLVNNSDTRAKIGAQLQQAIIAHHCGANWLARLATIKAQTPPQHRVYPDFSPACVAPALRDWWLCNKHANRPSSDARAHAERIFIEAWKRTDSKPQIDLPLWRELTVAKPIRRADFFRRWRLNHRIRSRGGQEKTIMIANAAVRTNRYALARKTVYRGLWNNPTSLLDLEWLKLFFKAHVGIKLVSKIQSILAARNRYTCRNHWLAILGYCLLDGT